MRRSEGSVLEKGIYTAKAIKAGASPLMIKRAEAAVTQYLKDGKFMVALGGEHSVSIGPIKAYSGHYQNLSILHLDAHADSRDSYEGSRYNHACVIARAREHVKNIVSVGIRSMDISEIPNVDPKRMFYAHAIHDSEKWMTKAAAVLTDTVYVTIDVDVFETGIMPATGTPEPGGLGWYQVLKFLKIVATTKKIVGFDVVELCPSGARAPEFLAAKLVYTLLSYIFYL